MTAAADQLLIQSIRNGDAGAWEQLIERYEGRLLAFASSRLQNRAAAEDVVQETFLGFLVSLPNYDESTPLENWLFTICAHKLTDHLRREGRRPTIPLFRPDEDGDGELRDLPGSARRASSLMRSREGKIAEQHVITHCLRGLIQQWRSRGEYERLMCMELLFVLGMANKDVAARLNISEQAVANHKQFVVGKLKEAAALARLREFNLAEWGVQ